MGADLDDSSFNSLKRLSVICYAVQTPQRSCFVDGSSCKQIHEVKQ